MKIKTFLIWIIIGLCFCSCFDKSNDIKDEISPASSYGESFKNEKMRIGLTRKIHSGDTIAYKELRDIYFYSGHTKDFLENAVKMATDYDFPEAYLDVYVLLKTDIINNSNLKTNKLANYYLLKAHEKKVKQTEHMVKNRFGSLTLIPRSEDYWLTIIN